MPVLTEMDLRRSVVVLALPVVARLSLQMVVGLVDLAMVGRLGPAAIAAVGMANQVVFFLLGVITAFSIGTTALVARYIGAKDRVKAQETAIQSVAVTFVVAIGLAVFGYIFAHDIINILIGRMENTDMEIIKLGGIYMQMLSLSIPFFFSLVLFNGIFQGAGDMRTPLYIMAMSNVLNVIMNYLLIFGIGIFPALGVQGAGLGTAIARTGAAFVAFFILLKGHKSIKLNITRETIKVKWQTIREVLNIGLPAAMEQLIRNSGQTLLTILVAGLGTLPLAAHQVVMRALSISFMPGFGFGLAATTLVGQNLGAKQPERAEESGFMANKMAVTFMCIVGVMLFVFARGFINIFTDDKDVVNMATIALRVVALTMPFLGTSMTLAGALRGAGDTRWVMYVTAAGVWGARLIVSYVLAFGFGLGLTGAWLGLSLDFIVRAVFTFIRFKSGHWKLIKVRIGKKAAQAKST